MWGVGHAHWRTGTGPADWTPPPLGPDGGIRTAEREQSADKFSSPELPTRVDVFQRTHQMCCEILNVSCPDSWDKR